MIVLPYSYGIVSVNQWALKLDSACVFQILEYCWYHFQLSILSYSIWVTIVESTPIFNKSYHMSCAEFHRIQVAFSKWLCVHGTCNTRFLPNQSRLIAASWLKKTLFGGLNTRNLHGGGETLQQICKRSYNHPIFYKRLWLTL